MYNWTDGIGGVAFNIVKWVGVYVAWKLELFLWCYTGLDVIYIWGVVLFLIGSNVFTIKSRRDRCSRELIADDVWEAEDDKTCFLSVGVDSFDRLCLWKRPISLFMVQNSNRNLKYNKWE